MREFGHNTISMVGLCWVVKKKSIQPNNNNNQYVELVTYNKPAYALLDTEETHNYATGATP